MSVLCFEGFIYRLDFDGDGFYRWKMDGLEHLRRLLMLSQVRSLIPSGPPLRGLEMNQREPRSYEDFKPYLIFFSLIQLIYDVMFKVNLIFMVFFVYFIF